MQLLDQLADEVATMARQVQILISDNASPDDTKSQVQQFIYTRGTNLALCYFRQSENIGANGNLNFLISQANAAYCWSVADDDLLVSGALTKVVQALQRLTQDDRLMLVRVTDIEEWDATPRATQESTQQPRRYELNQPTCLPFLLAAPFLASIIIQTSTWLAFLPQLDPYIATDYTNWGVALLSAQQAGHFHLLDQECVRGNATMIGQSRIPTFRILVMGRVKIWHVLTRAPLRMMLKPPMLRLWVSGWKAVVAGYTDELKTMQDKWRALREGINLLGVQALVCLPLFIFSLIGSASWRKRLIETVRKLIRS